jgi:hypothetical protein
MVRITERQRRENFPAARSASARHEHQSTDEGRVNDGAPHFEGGVQMTPKTGRVAALIADSRASGERYFPRR